MSAFIFGAAGHALVIASVLDTDVTFLVLDRDAEDQMLESEYFSRIDDFRHANVYIGIGSNSIRRRIFDKLAAFDVKVATCISRHSFVARNADLGSGVVILPGAVIGARATIAQNSIVNTLSSVDHNGVLGPHSQLAAGVTFGGGVKTGDNCFFGVKSAVVPNTTLGNNVTVMAGSLVTHDIPDNLIVGGYPARTVKLSAT